MGAVGVFQTAVEGFEHVEAAGVFRRELLSKGGSVDADVLYRNFRGRDPEPDALLEKLGLLPENV